MPRHPLALLLLVSIILVSVGHTAFQSYEGADSDVSEKSSDDRRATNGFSDFDLVRSLDRRDLVEIRAASRGEVEAEKEAEEKGRETLDVASHQENGIVLENRAFIVSDAPPAATKFPPPNPSPRAFDLTLTLTLTPSCQSFFTTFLTSPRFIACRPFSFLLSTSSAFASFARDSRSINSTAAVVQASITAGSDGTCAALMSSLRTSITSDSSCRTDLAQGSTLASQALRAFQAYSLLLSSSSLLTTPNSLPIASNSSLPAQATFCYLSSILSPTPDDAYLWTLTPFGLPLPNGTRASCSECNRNLLNSFASAIGQDATLPMGGKNWAQTVAVVDKVCGGNFLDKTIKTSRTSRRLGLRSNKRKTTLALALVPFLYSAFS